MPDSLMYQEDHFVVLETNQPEQILTTEELTQKLRSLLVAQEALPKDLQQFASVEQQVAYLINTTCEFDLAPGQYLQWYAVRLEK